MSNPCATEFLRRLNPARVIPVKPLTCLQYIIFFPFTTKLSTNYLPVNIYFNIHPRQGHQEFPFGNSRESRTPKIPGENSREFLKFWRELRGVSRVLSFFQFLLLIKTFLVFNLTAFWAKPWMTSLTQLFVFIVLVYFQIMISKNHWTASEFRKLIWIRSLHDRRWGNSNRS